MPATIDFATAVQNFPALRGPGLSMRIAAGQIQVKREDEAAWSTLLAVSDITGTNGKNVELRVVGTALQGRQTGGDWATLFDLATLKGADGINGKNVELRVLGTALQGRQTGGDWATLFDLASLKGAPGIDGGLYPYHRPGRSPRYFTTDQTSRLPEAYASLDPAMVRETPEGPGWALTGEGWVVSKQSFPVEPDRIYAAQAVFFRLAAHADPAGDTTRFGLLCEDKTGAVIATVTVQDWISATIGERRAATGLFSRLSLRPDGVLGLPAPTVAARLFLRAFGGTQSTAVVTLAWTPHEAVTAEIEGSAARSLASATISQNAAAQAVAAVASGRVSMPTKAELDAVLDQFPDNTVGVVETGFEAGEYVKRTGAWRYRGPTVAQLGALMKLSDDGAAYLVLDPQGQAAFEISRDGRSVWTAGFEFRVDAGGTLRLRDYAGADILARTAGGGLVVTDPLGHVGMELSADGRSFSAAGWTLGSGYAPGVELAITDSYGQILTVLSGEGAGGASNTSFSSAEIATRDARALALANATRGERRGGLIQRPEMTAIAVIASVGQSYSLGQQGTPALSIAQPYDTVMLGDVVHDIYLGRDTWEPVGAPVFRPLVAVNFDGHTGVLQTRAEMAALRQSEADISHYGENPLHGALNAFRAMQLARAGKAADPDHILCGGAYGRSGANLNRLTKGAPENYWNKGVEYHTRIKAAATALGKSVALAAVVFWQGQGDQAATHANRLAALRKYRADTDADHAAGIYGQSRRPPFFLFQSGGKFTRNTSNLGCQTAEMEFGLDLDNYLIGPEYEFIDRFGHLSANGYRHAGLKLAKVMHRVLILEQGWRPLYCLGVARRGRQLLASFHVPAPPLRWGSPYSLCAPVTATEMPHQGFRVSDAVGTVPIAGVEIVGDTQVLIILAADPTGAPRLWYADEAQVPVGYGRLMDSDASVVSGDTYEYIADAGMDVIENIPELVGKPYPMANWALAFSMVAVAA